VLILLLDDIKIINFLHVKFFRNSTYFFCRNITSSFKKRSFRKLINKGKLHSDKLKKIEKIIINFYLIKKVFYTITKQKNTHYFIKNLKEIKCLFFFKEMQKTN